MKPKIAATTIALVLITLATTTWAGNPPHQQRDLPPHLDSAVLGTQGHALLTSSPYLRELAAIRKQAAEREQALYCALRNAQDLDEVHRLVRRVRRLETETELEILKVQEHYAHAAGMLNLEREIRARILEYLEFQTASIRVR